MTALGEDRLQDEGFLECQTTSSLGDVVKARRTMHGAKCPREIHQGIRGPHGRRKRVRQIVHVGQQHIHRAGDIPRGHLGGGWIQRDDFARECVDNIGVDLAFEEHVCRMGELAFSSVRRNSTSEESPASDAQITLAPLLIEEGERELTAPIADDDLGDRSTLTRHPSVVDTDDLRNDRGISAIE